MGKSSNYHEQKWFSWKTYPIIGINPLLSFVQAANWTTTVFNRQIIYKQSTFHSFCMINFRYDPHLTALFFCGIIWLLSTCLVPGVQPQVELVPVGMLLDLFLCGFMLAPNMYQQQPSLLIRTAECHSSMMVNPAGIIVQFTMCSLNHTKSVFVGLNHIVFFSKTVAYGLANSRWSSTIN